MPIWQAYRVASVRFATPSLRKTFARWNFTVCPVMASRYGVLSIPMVALFKDGEMVERVVGAKPKERLVQELRLDSHAAAAA